MKTVYFIFFLFISVAGFSQIATDPVKEEISLYPNPAKTTLWINLNNNDIESKDIAVYNILGNNLKLQVEKNEEGQFSIDVNQLPAGYYLLVVENQNLQFAKTVKFLKK